MKTTLAALFLTFAAASHAHAQDFQECVEAGASAGERVAEQFCNVLEAKYNNTQQTHVVKSQNLALCEWAIAVSCRNNMAAWTSNNRPLCTWLVNNDWQGAWDQWASTQQAGCPYNPQPATVSCPAGAFVHRERFCAMPDGRYLAAKDGLWWTFQSKREHDGETHYVMRASDGAVALFRFGELEIVSSH